MGAAHVEGIVSSFPGRRGRRSALRHVWTGVDVVVVMVTSMIHWMRLRSRDLKHDLTRAPKRRADA